MTDPVAAFIRAEREALLQAAPAPHAARLWHEARRRNAASLRRSMRAAGWLVRLAVALATLASLLAVRPEANFLAVLFILSLWLTRGACAPLRPDSRKGTLL
ncbi:MAG TPA: hypothetical protein VLK25_11780 [Allosphingosinicella sp.]|nr:hypothetical protein [Allosphingosinicella sp.]